MLMSVVVCSALIAAAGLAAFGMGCLSQLFRAIRWRTSVRCLGRMGMAFMTVLALKAARLAGMKTDGGNGAAHRVAVSPRTADEADDDVDAPFNLHRLTAIRVGDSTVEVDVAWPVGAYAPGTPLELFAAPRFEDNPGAVPGVPSPWRLYATVLAGTESSAVFTVARTEAFEPSGFFRVERYADADGDGLSDARERLETLTRADAPDTDGDGLDDGEEVALGLLPNIADSDEDGIEDRVERGWMEIDMSCQSIPWDVVPLLDDGEDGRHTVRRVRLPFPVTLGGIPSTNLVVSSDGVVAFAPVWNPSAALALPARHGPVDAAAFGGPFAAVVAACWDEDASYPATGRGVLEGVFACSRQTAEGRLFAIGFRNPACTPNAGVEDRVRPFEVYVVLSEADPVAVRVVYQSLGRGQDFSSAALGAQGAAGRLSFPVSCDLARSDLAGRTVVYRFGTGGDPARADTDEDGLDDDAERLLGTDPRAADSDGDGLGDAVESGSGTDPCNPDSDADGLPDGWEVRYGLDPTDASDGAEADSDGDHVSNGREFALGGDPTWSDTDGDGLADGAEAGWIDRGASCPVFLSAAHDLLPPGQACADGTFEVDLPFPLVSGTRRASRVLVNSNGILAFPDDAFGAVAFAPGAANADLSAPVFSERLLAVVAVWWDDLFFPAVRAPLQGIFYDTVTVDGVRYFTLGYRNPLPAGWSAGTVPAPYLSAGVVLSEADPSTVYVRYEGQSFDFDGRSATVGAQGPGRMPLPVSFNAPWWPSGGTVVAYHLGTGTSPARADTDLDGLDDAREIALGTDPAQPDTDGDGMDDGWEVLHSQPMESCDTVFDPLVDNEQDADPGNDASADVDGDGLSNRDECMWRTDPRRLDTDGDNVNDGEEVGVVERAAGGPEPSEDMCGTPGFSDPTDATDGGVPGSRAKVTFSFGDPSESASEKYRLELVCVEGDGHAESRINQSFGGSESQSVALKPGCAYEVRFAHAGTDPGYTGTPRPDYDYQLEIENPPPSLIVDDILGLLGFHSDDVGKSFENVQTTKVTIPKYRLVLISDKKSDFDLIVPNSLMDSRAASVSVRTEPPNVDLSKLNLSLSCSPVEQGELVNDGHGTDVSFEQIKVGEWRTSTIYWYGVKSGKDCYTDWNAYRFVLHNGEAVLYECKCVVMFPQITARASWTSPASNATTCGIPRYVQSDSENYWCCDILFEEFEKDPGSIELFNINTGKRFPFEWTWQYADKIRSEELFHLKQLRGEVPFGQGGFADCWTIKGIKYFVSMQAAKVSYIDTTNWIVKGATALEAFGRAESVVNEAILQERLTSSYIMSLSSNELYRELTAKEHIGYNAAFRYHCTYAKRPGGANPERIRHPAYIETPGEN